MTETVNILFLPCSLKETEELRPTSSALLYNWIHFLYINHLEYCGEVSQKGHANH